MGAQDYVDPQAYKKPTPTAAALTAAAGVPAASGFSSVSPTAVDFSSGQGRVAVQPIWHPQTGFGQNTTPGFWEHPANEISSHVGGAQSDNTQYSGFRASTLGDLQNAGLWSNVGDFQNSPLWQAYGKASPKSPYGDLSDPGKQAIGLLSMAGLGPTSRSEDFQKAFAGQNLTPEQIQQIQGHLTAQSQDMASTHWEDIAGNMFQAAMMSLLMGPAVGSLSELTGLGGSTIQGIGQAGIGMLSGGKPTDIAKSLALGQAGSAAANFATPMVNDFANSLGLSGQQVADSEAFKLPKNGIQVADASDILGGMPMGGAFSTPGTTSFDAAGNPVSSTPAMTTMGSGFGAQSVPTAIAGGMLSSANVQNNLDQQDKDALQQQQQQGVTGKDIQQYAKLAQSVNSFLGKNSQQGPQRAEGQSDQAYSQQLAQYMNLDAEAMAKQGLVPGTPEYEQYIMQQANSVIQQSGIDPNGDLTQQLQGHTQQEIEQLQRALYVRGQMDTLVGPGQYTDPFTGQKQDVNGPQGSTFNPSMGAYDRGLAGSVDQLQALGGSPEASNFLQGMLGRHADLFGMQKAQDASLENARLNDQIAQEQQGKHKKGMLSPGRGNMFNSMTPDELQQLVMRSGGDESTQRAALEQLLGIPGYSG